RSEGEGGGAGREVRVGPERRAGGGDRPRDDLGHIGRRRRLPGPPRATASEARRGDETRHHPDPARALHGRDTSERVRGERGQARGPTYTWCPGSNRPGCVQRESATVTARPRADRHAPPPTVLKSAKLASVCYDIRGPVLARAKLMEEEGHRIIKLNIGNPAPFGFEAPEEIVQDMIHNLPQASGYCDSKGLFSARKAIMHYTQQKHVRGVTVEDIYVGNGASELIVMSMQALLDAGDEVLIPAPDYPLWTAAVSLSGGTPRHYLCDEQAGWLPDLADLRAKISPHTRALVVINPNNPTGALYSEDVLTELLAIARQHGLIVFADEIYDNVLYDRAPHTAIASLADDLLIVTFGGLSKNYRACGFRAGWMIVSGERSHARDYIEGLDILASMRLCANVPAQYGIQT